MDQKNGLLGKRWDTPKKVPPILHFLLVVSLTAVFTVTAQYDDDDNTISILGIVPELFEEDDDSNLNLYGGDSMVELDRICQDPHNCAACKVTAINSRMLSKYRMDNTTLIPCDELAEYNFNKLQLAKMSVKAKSGLIRMPIFAIVCFSVYIACLVLGIGLCFAQHFNFKTLWDKLAADRTKGMRSFRYERMNFKFDYADPGSAPEGDINLEGWTLYRSSDEEDEVSGEPSDRPVKKSFTLGGGRAKAALQKQRLEERLKQDKVKGPKIWPWQRADYDFSQIPYRAGLRKDMDDWREEEGSNFTSNI